MIQRQQQILHLEVQIALYPHLGKNKKLTLFQILFLLIQAALNSKKAIFLREK
jgi:hypothetical protein